MQIDLTWTPYLEDITSSFLTGAVVIWIIGSALLSRILPLGISLTVVGVKLLICAAYFLSPIAGTWYIGADDAQYFEAGLALVRSDFDLFSIWFSPVGKYLLLERESVGLVHYWNMVWLTLLEEKYYSPILGNILLSILAGICWFKILRQLDFSILFSQGAVIFFLLHWTTVTWTSFLNMKEPLVIAVASFFLLCMVGLLQKRWAMIIPGLACFLLFGYLRFYIPILIILGLFGGYFLRTQYSWKWMSIGLITGACLYLTFDREIRMVVTDLFVFDPGTVIKGIAKQFLSPLPWQVSPESGYQLLGSMLHLVMLPVAFFGIYLMIRTKDNLVIFLGVALVVYAVLSLTPNLWTPRHRIVGDIIWIFFEYYGLYSLVRINQALNSRVRWQT